MPPSLLKVHRAIAILLLILSLFTFPAAALAVEVSPADRAEIARTRAMAIEALNTRDFSKIAPYLHPTFTITTVDNRVFHNAKDFEAYWSEQMSGPIQKIEMDVTVDEKRNFLSPETEVAYGDAKATFHFKDGNVQPMAMRWTAVLQKLQNKWMLQSVHFSSNLLDNPVLDGAKSLVQTTSLAAGLGGLLLGAGAMWLLRRKPKSVSRVE